MNDTTPGAADEAVRDLALRCAADMEIHAAAGTSTETKAGVIARYLEKAMARATPPSPAQPGASDGAVPIYQVQLFPPRWEDVSKEEYDTLHAPHRIVCATPPSPAQSGEIDCARCCGNGEVVTNWDEYLHPPTGADADHATADCPDCNGTGRMHAPSPAQPGASDGAVRTALEWVRDEIIALCEATENDSSVAAVSQFTEGKQGAYARGRAREAAGIRNAMAEVIRERLAATRPVTPARLAESAVREAARIAAERLEQYWEYCVSDGLDASRALRVLEEVAKNLRAALADTAQDGRTNAAIDPCLVKREPDEPMFVLLARDSAAPATLESWCRLRQMEIMHGVRPDTEQEREHIREIGDKADVFRAWRKANRHAAMSRDAARGAKGEG